MPSQQSILRDNCRDILQHFSADRPDFRFQTALPFVDKPKSPGSEVNPKDAVLLPQIRNRMLLLLIHPTIDCDEQKAKWVQRLRHVLYSPPSRISDHTAG